MSGHSKWHKIKRAKEATDQKKSQLYGKLVREIQVAAGHEADPARNAALRDALARARKANMPQANIDRLLQQPDQTKFTEVVYEGFGPAGVAILIISYTDNPNRTVAEVRHLLKAHGGHLAAPSSVRWKFIEVARVFFDSVPPGHQEKFHLAMIDGGANDVVQTNDTWLVVTSPDHVSVILTAAQALGLPKPRVAIDFVSRQVIAVAPTQRQAIDKLVQELSNQEDIASIHLETIQYE